MPKPSAEDRLGRLLAIVPWVAAHDGPEVAEVCRRFGVGEKELLEDLELLFMCGIHPFTPDVLIDVDVAEGRVWIRMADYFRRPLRLSPQEGLALLSAGSVLLSVPGADADGALATALSKLEMVLGVGTDEGGLEVELARVTPTVLHAVRQATAAGRKIDLDYYSFGRDGHSTRVVQPWRVFNASGQWYLAGWCELARGERLFRVDRITRAEITDSTFDPPPGPPSGATDVYHPSPEDSRIVLDLDPPTGSRSSTPTMGWRSDRTWCCASRCAPASSPGWSVCCCGQGRMPAWLRATRRSPLAPRRESLADTDDRGWFSIVVRRGPAPPSRFDRPSPAAASQSSPDGTHAQHHPGGGRVGCDPGRRRTGGHPHQDVRRPAVLHPLGLDGTDAHGQ